MIATFLCYFFYLFTRRTIVNKSKSGRQAIQVDRVIKYRPVSDHKANVSTLIFSKFLFNHNGMRTLCNTIHAHDILEWKSKSCISGYPCNLETSLKSLFFFPLIKFIMQFSQTHFFLEELFNSMFSSLPIQSCNLSSQIEHEKKKKEEGKRAREDEDVVKALLFNAFERHQYYNLKDLITITKQPVVSDQK